MLSTASALIEATQNAVLEQEQMELAAFITHSRETLDQKQFASAMFMYATAIASAAVDNATKVLLTETQLGELMNTIQEMDIMRDSVLEENK